jgi:hypothetical protein
VHKVEVSRSTLSLIEYNERILQMIDCDKKNNDINHSDEDFIFNLIDEIDGKRIERHALGKSGFVVAIGPVQ